jgi:hypothetical protein
MATDETALREQIKRDFGLDLPIGSGSASSRDNPLVILASDPHDVALTEMPLLRCFGDVFEKLWRVRARVAMEGRWRNVEQVKVETKQLTSTEVVTEETNYYFDVSALIAGKDAGPHDPRQAFTPGYVDPATGILFPYEIGWMHLDKAVDNEPAHPGLGLTISYSALNIQASVYVYSKNIEPFPEMFDLNFVTPEFDAGASDLLGFNSDVRSADDRTLTVSRGGTSYLRQAFEIGARQSVLALTAARRSYVKLRGTWLAEPLFDEIGNEFIDAVFDLATTASRPH